MERLAYIILGIVAAGWLIATLAGMIVAMPMGMVGLLAILGFGLLFIKVLRERRNNKEDDYYDKNIEK